MIDYLIVGAGLFGSVFAHEMNKRGQRCLVIDKRQHIGGNCYTETREGIETHVYGPHIFHTDSQALWDYVGRFCEFRPYIHSIVSRAGKKDYSFPINLRTLKQIFETESAELALARFEQDREAYRGRGGNDLESWCLSQVGPTLYERLIKGYTTKQWQTSPCELNAAIIKRLPVRMTEDDNYYTHRFQGLPVGGYTQIFERLLEGIDVRLGVDFFNDRAHFEQQARKIVYTGRIDQYFDYRFGPLGWRSLDFKWQYHDTSFVQKHIIVNHADIDVPYTRTVEYKHWMADAEALPRGTLLVEEYSLTSTLTSDAYYPINTIENKNRYDQYLELTRLLKDRVVFGGRLARYAYIDMAPTISMALNSVTREIKQ